jgi:hypothetical protein
MKLLIWIIVIVILIWGGCHFYKSNSSKKTVSPSPPAIKDPTSSRKAIENWRPVKKVLDLSKQHNKDLEGNL